MFILFEGDFFNINILSQRLGYFQNIYTFTYQKTLLHSRNFVVDGCSSKQNLFGRSASLMNAAYIVFP